MAVTGTITTRELIEDALRKIGVVAFDEPMTADQSASGLRAWNRLLKSWQNRGYNLWAVDSQTVTLTTAASYTLSPVRPMRILNARLVRNGIETPMTPMTRQEYDAMPVKASTGLPTQFYYDRQREAAVFYIWPVLAVAGGETIKITFEREAEDQTDINAAPDIPGEWWEAAVYGLAARMADDYSRNVPNVIARAEEELRLALADDREESVFFGDPY
jgi:hypothetical protein